MLVQTFFHAQNKGKKGYIDSGCVITKTLLTTIQVMNEEITNATHQKTYLQH
jgi:hypothetical protein